MSKHEDILNEGLDAAKRLREFAEDPATRAQVKDWADEATKFVQRNPWAAVAGAALIGYFLGTRSARRRDEGGR